MRKSLFLLFCASVISIFVRCEKSFDPTSADNEQVVNDKIEPIAGNSEAVYSQSLTDAMGANSWHHEESGDYNWDSTQVVQIALNGNAITVNGAGASVSGSRATITSSGTYEISGSLTDGQIIVNTQEEQVVRLILDGIDIRNTKSAPMYVQDAKKVILILADNSENYVADGASYVFENADKDEPNAAIFSTSDLTIYGNGSLTVEGNYNNAIASKDGLIIARGSDDLTAVDDGINKNAAANAGQYQLADCSINVTAVDDGIRGKDYLVIKDANITVQAGGDGLKSDNTEDAARGYVWIMSGNISITSKGDAIDAETDALISDYIITLTSGGGSNFPAFANASTKGIKGLVNTIIAGGAITINSADDALHSNKNIVIDSGAFAVATNDDAIHADAAVTINGGTLYISKYYEGIESATITVNGGYIAVNCSRGDGLDSNGSAMIAAGTVIVHGPASEPEVGFDVNGTFRISGGFFIATGPNSGHMIEFPRTTSAQYSVGIYIPATLSASSLFHIQDANGDEIVTFKPARKIYYIAFSSPKLMSGVTYSICLGGSSTDTSADGLYDGGTYSGGTLRKSFAISDKVTKVSI